MFTLTKTIQSTILGVLVFVMVTLFVPTELFAQPTGFDTTEDFESSTLEEFGIGSLDAAEDFNFGPPEEPTQSNVNSETQAGSRGVDTSGTVVDPPSAGLPAAQAFEEAPLRSLLYLLVNNFFGSLVTLGGILLEFAIYNFVINFGLEFNTSGVGVAVNELWSIVRDFFNILFIFGFVYIGFQMILNSSNSAAKKTLASLIAAALLVNFSLFISKFIVDFSNRIATELAEAAFTDQGSSQSSATGSNLAIADTFFTYLGTAQTLNVPEIVTREGGQPWFFIFGSAIFYLITAFVFAAGGIMLIIRFVALCIFMVLSPFMFLGWVFPGMQGWTSRYWKGFLGRAFYAPVYIILLFFSATILENMFGAGGSSQLSVNGQATTGGLLQNVTNSENNLFILIGPFALAATFLIASVIVAGKMSADGASGVMKVGGNLQRGGRRRLQNGAIGLGRFGARNTAGLVTTYGVNRAGEAGREALRRRNAQLAQSNSRFDRWKARTSERTTGAALDRVATATVAGSETRADRLARVNKEQDALNKSRDQYKKQEDIDAAQKVLENNKDTNDSTQLEARRKAFAEIAAAGSKLSPEVIATLSKDELLTLARQGGITDANMKTIKDSGRFTNDENKEISDNRVAGISDRAAETLDSTAASAEELNTALDQLAQNIQRLSDDELKAYKPKDIISNQRLALSLSDKQIETYQSSGIASADEIRQIKETRAKAQIAITEGKATEIFKNNVAVGTAVGALEAKKAVDKRRERMLKGSASDVGKLPAAVFKNKENLKLIAPSALAERDKNGLSQTDVSEITAAIKSIKYSDPNVWNKWNKWANTPQGVSSSFDLS